MNFKVVVTCFLLALSFVSYTSEAQFSMALGGSGYYFVNSKDNNLHFGPQLRANFDWDNKVLSFGGSYFLPVISKVPTTATKSFVAPIEFPPKINIINSVSAYSIDAFTDFHYYFRGVPIDGNGFYGIAGAGMFFYNQTYSLSNFDRMAYTSIKYFDEQNYYSTQLTFDIGIGGKIPMRKKSWYYELKFTFLTDPYKDYDRAVQGSHFITFSTGINFHLKTRKGKFQRMAMGRTKKQRKKSVSKIRK